MPPAKLRRVMAQRSVDLTAIEAEIERVSSLGLDKLREMWRATFRSSPPSAFSKDLIVRFVCWHIQEQAFGCLDRATDKLLGDLTRGNKPQTDRRLKAGTVLVREYNGERHAMTVVPGGYVWRENTYASLSTIARAITGTAWNGPRFFLIEHYVESVRIKREAVEIHLVNSVASSVRSAESHVNDRVREGPPTALALPWNAPSFVAVKGIAYAPRTTVTISPENRDALLSAIANARRWIDDLRFGRVASFAEIAKREVQGERYIRLLSSLAFVSPRIVTAIVNGTAPSDLTVSGLAKGLPYLWAEQEQRIGLFQ